MDQPRRILDPADELLSEILTFLLESESRALNDKFYLGRNHSNRNGDYRQFQYGESSDLDRFRLVCKRFMRIGTPRKFSRFNLRFSEDGFRRLGELLAMQRAHYVKTVTYLVRPFYQGSGWTPVLQALARDNRAVAELHSQRLREQTKLVETNYDLTQICLGVAAFEALQEIKLLRLQDEADEYLLDLIRGRSVRNIIDSSSSATCFDWGLACSRAVTNLGIALLNSQCSAIRFIGPQISPEATLQLLRAPSTTLAAMGTRLTSLDINFHSDSDLTATMSDLSTVFHRFFLEAKALAAIHIGFPPEAPLDLNLESIFHGIRWKTLRTLSLQGWRLHADEIMSLLRRHRRQIRDFRLFAVYLRPWGLWKDVLTVLRDEMERLERVNLRGIDYTEHFDALAQTDGIEVFDIPVSATVPSSLSFATRTDIPDQPVFMPGLGSNGFGFSPVMQTGRVPIRPSSIEKLRELSKDDLGDNGIIVPREQLQLWAAWVMAGAQRSMQHGNGNGNANGHIHAYHI